ncbi:UDP-glucuronosyltransferase 1-2-like [Amblyraja radiata]|uniref:UDP-glucuronosyltransferase 1-2-like n=1 Tax=Amblyraja radiata TaxID=386614 RepID=UPI00140305B4|nr:UDP-glucuronosyltransferase 1-2-like [Amblyraja radiata]
MSVRYRAASLALLLGAALFSSAGNRVSEAAKILAVPADWSHWIIMKTLLLELVASGHQVTVLRSNDSRGLETTSEDFTLETILVPAAESHKARNASEIRDIVFNSLYVEDGFLSSFAAARSMLSLFLINKAVTIPAIRALFDDRALLQRLKGAGFDLTLADPYHAAGATLAQVLGTPLVFFGRWMITGDLHFNLAPSPLSFVPVVNSRLSDRMSVWERMKNVLIYGMSRFTSYFYIYPAYNELCRRYLDSDITVEELYAKADMVLMKVDFVFDYPRPTMPNLVYIGGVQCSAGRPLSAELQRFMDGSGDQGVVIFSLGSVVSISPPELATELAAGLARLPQRVVWRLVGDAPSTLGNNTKVMSWLPQNDLLSHPKTRAFITHGGENGLYEAMYHGVPLVGIPVFGDQYDNLLRLKTRGAAVMLDLAHLTSDVIFQAVKTVIETPSYGENMKRISALHRDVPLEPKALAVFWIEYTIRHRGAAHLGAAGTELPFYQYYLLDVIAILVAVSTLALYLTCKLLKALLIKISSGGKRKLD